MSDFHTCPKGHRWEREPGLSAEASAAPCPICRDENLTIDVLPPGDKNTDDQATLNPASTPLVSATEPLTIGPEPAGTSGQPPSVSGYTILGELGRGGMGVVYKAQQKGLKRLVALKMILGGAHAGSEQVLRFRAEAEAVARLQHPYIVQIYEVGEADGFPYFSLEFVEGGCLADKLDGTPQAPRPAAQTVQLLAEAMHYAHEHGIVHRDLKPANVLLSGECRMPSGERPKDTSLAARPAPLSSSSTSLDHLLATTPYGVPKITDFGLAKPVQGESGLTRSGAILGTPSYMAPEQAENRAVGPPADVYALGAILYEMLTGRPPFRAGTPLDTILQLISEDAVPPSRLHPNLPADLETICLKCLEKEPAKRYASALGLAEDLRRYLADEPILARPTGPVRRALKWARRRPALAGLIGVSVLSLAVVAGVILVAAVRLKEQRDIALDQKEIAELQRNAANRAKEEADKERRRAEVSFERARNAVDQMLTRVGDERLRNVPLMEELQRDLLEEALKFNKQFLQDDSTDPTVMRETGRAYYRAGGIRALLGQHEQSCAAYQDAIKLQQQLLNELPDQPDCRRELAQSQQGLARQLQEIGSRNEADQAYRAAAELLEGLVECYPDKPSYRQELAMLYDRQGGLYCAMARWEDVEPIYGKAIALQEQLVARFPRVPAYRRDQGLTQGSYGRFLTAMRRPKESEAAFRKAIAIQEGLVKESPKEVAYREDLILSQSNLTSFLGESNRLNVAQATIHKVIEDQTALVADFPRVPSYRRSLASTYVNLGIMLDMLGRKADSISPYRQALAQFEPLVVECPKVPGYRMELAGCLNNLAVVLAETGKRGEAETLYRRAADTMQGLLTEFPKDRGYHHDLARVQGNLARLIQKREPATARRLIDEAIFHTQTALQMRPGHQMYLRQMHGHYVSLADLHLASGDYGAAGKVADRLAEVHPKEWAGDYESACLLSRCVPLIQKDSKLEDARKKALARTYGDRAIARLRAAVPKGMTKAEDLKKDTDFDPIRSREEFQKLVHELEAKAVPNSQSTRP